MANERIVIIDDEPSLIKFVGMNLRARGYEVAEAANGPDGVALVKDCAADLMIVDIGLPGMDGFEVCGSVRDFSDVPIIVLTASGNVADKIRALDLGADDYLTKPFAVGELIARVRAVMRRSRPIDVQTQRREPIQTADFCVDFADRHVVVRGKPGRFTPTEYSLLEQLVTRPDRVLTHDELLATVWGPEYLNETDFLRVYMGRLRRKLEPEPANPRYFLTEAGVGYCFRAGDWGSAQRPLQEPVT
jgi:two-component system, OmpR family, KDP operon response regulator KdpE